MRKNGRGKLCVVYLGMLCLDFWLMTVTNFIYLGYIKLAHIFLVNVNILVLYIKWIF